MGWDLENQKWPEGSEPPACTPSREMLMAEDMLEEAKRIEDEVYGKATGAVMAVRREDPRLMRASALRERAYTAKGRYARMMVKPGSSVIKREDLVHPEKKYMEEDED